MITILSISSELSEFYGFLKVPHKSQISRFKSDLLENLNELFNNLVDFTEVISQEINPFLSSILITDTTGAEVYVTENNLKRSKFHSKFLTKTNPNSGFDVEKYEQS